MATSGDILLATREDFSMATDTRAQPVTRAGDGHLVPDRRPSSSP